jgi:hypothetical protein
MYKYLIVKCKELNDQYECEADRKIICMTNNYQPFKKYGYEVYEMRENGSFKLIQEFDYFD